MEHNKFGGVPLAYLGDAVIEVWVRKKLLSLGVTTTASCNAEALLFVKARSQSGAFSRVEDMLTEEETDIFRRGRNAHVTSPKSASVAEYHRATGFEALCGALCLDGRTDRVDELLGAAYADVIKDVAARHGGGGE